MTEYYDHPGINQSTLVALSRGIGTYKTKKEETLYYKDKPHFDLGDAVDILITRPDDFDSCFYISDDLEAKPTDTALSIVKQVFDKTSEPPESLSDESLRDTILECCKEHNYGGTTWLEDTKYTKILEKGEIYYLSLYHSRGRGILSTEQKMNVESMVAKIKEHDFTGWLFAAEYLPGVEVVYQEFLEATYRGHLCKGLLDMGIINHNEHPIFLEGRKIPAQSYLPIDIKTIGDSVKAFPRALFRRRYDVQGAWYSHLLELNYPGYKILPFLFVVISTTTNEHPLIYQSTREVLEVGRWGGKYINGRLTPSHEDPDKLGFEQMLDLYEWHEEHGYEYDKYIAESRGIIKLEL